MQDFSASLDAMIFDLDGTLVDSRVGVIAAVARGIREVTRRHFGEAIEVEDSILRDALGKPAVEYYRSILPPKLQHLALEVKSVATAHEVEALASGHGQTYPGVVPTLRTLRAGGVKLAVVSNAQKPYFEAALHHLEIRPELDHSECYEELPEGTAPPYKLALLRRAIDVLGVNPQRCCMVGDRAEDLEAGIALGCHTAGVRFGFGRDEELAIGERRVDAFEELLAPFDSAPS